MNKKIIRPLLWVPMIGMAVLILLAKPRDMKYYRLRPFNPYWVIFQGISIMLFLTYHLILKS